MQSGRDSQAAAACHRSHEAHCPCGRLCQHRSGSHNTAALLCHRPHQEQRGWPPCSKPKPRNNNHCLLPFFLSFFLPSLLIVLSVFLLFCVLVCVHQLLLGFWFLRVACSNAICAVLVINCQNRKDQRLANKQASKTKQTNKKKNKKTRHSH